MIRGLKIAGLVLLALVLLVVVSVGDKVLRGQPLTRGRGKMLPVHAPTSGTVTAIAPHSTAHPSALAELSVIIDADGEDCWIPRDGWADYRTRSREELIERIHQFGVAGLGARLEKRWQEND